MQKEQRETSKNITQRQKYKSSPEVSLYIKNGPRVPKSRPVIAAVPDGCALRWLRAAFPRSTGTTVETPRRATLCVCSPLARPRQTSPLGRPVLVPEEEEQGGAQQQVRVHGDRTGPCCCQPVSACPILVRYSAVVWGFSVGGTSRAGWEDTVHVTARGGLSETVCCHWSLRVPFLFFLLIRVRCQESGRGEVAGSGRWSCGCLLLLLRPLFHRAQ